MLSVRKVKTKSSSIAVQIVYYKNRRVKVIKHIGSGKTTNDIELLIDQAKKWITKNTLQEELFVEHQQTKINLDELEYIGETHNYTYEILSRVAQHCGIKGTEERLLLDFAIMRLVEPASKLRTIKLLKRYFEIQYSERTVYRKILNLSKKKPTIETIAQQCAKEMLQDDLAIVLYDVTTLYFETFNEDELRKKGFSKDNKSQQPQIIIGLIVTRNGFPLSYEVFVGNTFEGKTMLSIIENFTKRNRVKHQIVVADAAMLSQENLEKLKQRNLSYIVGARLGNTQMEIIKHAYDRLHGLNGKSIRMQTAKSELIIEFNQKRYRKDKHEMKKQLLKAEQLIKSNQPGKRAKFVKHKNNEEQYTLNKSLVEKTSLLLGMKGYYTNIPENILSNQEIIIRYHDLWHVEQAFRMAKNDLASRPVFHYKTEAVKSHILICFTALMIGKYLEINTKLSLKQVIDAIWVVTDAKLFDKSTNKPINLRAKISSDSYAVIEKIDGFLSY